MQFDSLELFYANIPLPDVPYQIKSPQIEKFLTMVPLFTASLSIFAGQFKDSLQCKELVGRPPRQVGKACTPMRGPEALCEALRGRLLEHSVAVVNEQVELQTTCDPEVQKALGCTIWGNVEGIYQASTEPFALGTIRYVFKGTKLLVVAKFMSLYVGLGEPPLLDFWDKVEKLDSVEKLQAVVKLAEDKGATLNFHVMEVGPGSTSVVPSGWVVLDKVFNDSKCIGLSATYLIQTEKPNYEYLLDKMKASDPKHRDIPVMTKIIQHFDSKTFRRAA